MKSCPVCGARTFDDAQTCYGCLHRFEGGETDAAGMPIMPVAQAAPTAYAVPVARATQPTEGSAMGNGEKTTTRIAMAKHRRRTERESGVPEFFIRFTPVVDQSGSLTWSCAVEA